MRRHVVLDEREIIRHCDSRVLRRARNIARSQDAIFERGCTYAAGGKLHVRAQVAGTSSRSQAYDVRLRIDQHENKVSSYECTCSSSLVESGMCKHAAATALAFAANPSSFRGFVHDGADASSDGVRRLLRALRQHDTLQDGAPAGQGCGPEEPVRLCVVLVHDAGTWSMRLRVARGKTRYAVRDLWQFAHAVCTGAYATYGTGLGFAHVQGAFAAPARPLLGIVSRALAVRAQLEQASVGAVAARPGGARGELALTEAELVEVLEACRGGVELLVDDTRELDHAPRKAAIIEGNPPVRVVFAEDDGGFSFQPEGYLDVLCTPGAFYVWCQRVFYRCEEGLRACESFLRLLYADSCAIHHIGTRDVPEFCANVLPELQRNVEVLAPASMLAQRPQPCAVEAYLDYGAERVTCRAWAVYGQERHDLLTTAASSGAQPRDMRAERRASRVLLRWFSATPEADGQGGQRIGLELAGTQRIGAFLVEGLAQLRGVAEVFTTSSFDALICKRKPQVLVGLSMKSNLIDLSVTSDVLSRRELAEVLASYKQRKRFHHLADGTFLDLDSAQLASASSLLDELDIEAPDLLDGDVLLPRWRAFQLDALVGEGCEDEAFRAYLSQARAATGPKAHGLPAHLADAMRPYQVEGYEWLCTLADAGLAGILADEMGLGKSLQLIAFLATLHAGEGAEGPSIIVCPASLVYNWVAEFGKFAPGLAVHVIAGAKEQRVEAIRGLARAGAPDVAITSYDLLKRDVDEYAGLKFASVTLDEAQYIKNAGTLASRSVKALAARHRFALTGTPVENRLSELWSIFDFLMPGLLGSYRTFRERFEYPIMNGDEAQLERLRARTGRFILRRLKGDVLEDLPAKSVNIVFSRMDQQQRMLYVASEQALRDSLRPAKAGTAERNRIEVLAELMRLRELCCDPRLVYEDYTGPSAKLATIVELVGNVADAGHKALVFSQFTSYLSLIAHELQMRGLAYYTITGSTPKKRRIELADAFNADATPVFLVSLKAGGTGLNLTGASVVIHADPWWNAAAEDQATDRSHRIGQTNEVTVYKVIAKDTIEERVVALQEAKGELAGRLIEDTGALQAGFSTEELLGLLGG